MKFDAEAGGYQIKITIEEGAQYKIGSVRIESHLREVSGDQLQKFLRLGAGDVYDGDHVQKRTEALTREVTRLGYAKTALNCVWGSRLFLGLAAGAAALDRRLPGQDP